jgi:DNA-binding NarL/FixJ family response regulator
MKLGCRVNMLPFITLLVAVPDDPFRQALLRSLADAESFRVVGLADSLPDGMAKAAALQPDVVLLATTLLNGNSHQAAEAGLFAGSKVLLVAEPGQEARLLPTLQLGARGYLVRDGTLLARLPDAICAVQRGEAILSPRLAGWMLDTILH